MDKSDLRKAFGPVVTTYQVDGPAQGISCTRRSEPDLFEVGETVKNPNEWFSRMFPSAVAQFGSGFLEGTWSDNSLCTRYTIAQLNDDAWAKALGGEQSLRLNVVYEPEESQFYAYEYRLDAFCPVSEEKLKLVLGWYLRRCCEVCNRFVDIVPLMTTFREDKYLDRIVKKAKSVLSVDHSFFHGQSSRRRYVAGRYLDAVEKPPILLFTEEAIVSEEGARLPVTIAHERFTAFCQTKGLPPVEMPAFRKMIGPVLEEAFNAKLRHDVVGENGKQQRGWFNLGLRSPPQRELLQN